MLIALAASLSGCASVAPPVQTNTPPLTTAALRSGQIAPAPALVAPRPAAPRSPSGWEDPFASLSTGVPGLIPSERDPAAILNGEWPADTPSLLPTHELASYALGYLGTRYRMGGSSPDTGFDCSGLVSYVTQQVLGLHLPRRAEEISRVGQSVEREELQPGDLVFYNTLRRKYSHVGIYLGEGRFVHSPSAGGVVRIESMDMAYWKTRFNGARRIALNEAAAR